jgi:hypothetical protein
VILDNLKPNTWDVFVGIMWHRFGTPTQKNITGSARNYLSGTEEEFRAAYSLWGKYKRPQVMFYWCKREISPDQIDVVQLERVKKFFKGFSPAGKNPCLYHEYKEQADFERVVRRHLGQLLFKMRPRQPKKTGAKFKSTR